MPESPYHVLGTDIPSLLGRSRLATQLRDRLTKPTPDHVTVVGPRHYGKSVLLKHLADEFAGGKGEYVSSVYWDLRHNTPTSHTTFLTCLASALKASLTDVGQRELADDLALTSSGVFDALEFVRDQLTSQRKRVLIVMDGFDHVLANDSLTRQTWDAMRTLSQGKGLVLVTGSRRGLRELCRTEESATSDFWEVFNPNPLRVGRFRQDDDWDVLVKPLIDRGISVERSAAAEVYNWTGGIPTLVVLLLDRLFDAVNDGGSLEKADVDRAANEIAAECRDVIAPLWDECDDDLKSAYLDLLAERQVRAAEFRADHKDELLLRGLACEDGSLIKASAQLVGNYARQQSTSLETLQRLFGEPERFVTNAKDVLEIRLKQLRVVDNKLQQMLRFAVASLSEPSMALMAARGITNRAFELIWSAEAPEGVIPEHWNLEEKDGEPAKSIPNGGGAKINLLRLITGTDRSASKTKCITKRTYALVNFLHSVGDHGQHLPEGEGTGPYVVAYCLAAIELAESLAIDLGSSREGFRRGT